MVDPGYALSYVAVGAVVGAIGQGARAAVGIQKARNRASEEQRRTRDWFELDRLLSSLLIGAVAGGLATVVWWGELIDQEFLLTLLGVGYAGTDFIESVLRREASDAMDQLTPGSGEEEGDAGGGGG